MCLSDSVSTFWILPPTDNGFCLSLLFRMCVSARREPEAKYGLMIGGQQRGIADDLAGAASPGGAISAASGMIAATSSASAR